MKKAILFRVAFAIVAIVALGGMPQPALAQHGGHGGGGGGGGFHGGGGGAGFHSGGGTGFHSGGSFSGGGHAAYGGGHSYAGYHAGYHGGGYYGGRGGYGWGGRGWGHGYGYGWGGWGWGFGWPYWGWGWGYPYGYGYNPYYYGSGYYYSYPGYGPADDLGDYQGDPGNGNDDPPPADPNVRPQPNPNGPARSWRPPAPGGTGNANIGESSVAGVAPRGAVLSVDRISATPSSHRAAAPTASTANIYQAGARTNVPLRPEVQRALQRLQDMPPFAREREIETGRYRQFSPQEKQILRDGD